MQSLVGRRQLIAGAFLCAFVSTGASSPEVASSRSCSPVVNPYAGTRYEGTNLRGIRAVGVSCSSARQVARGAHRKALGLTPTRSGVRRLTWNGWRVTADLRPAVDRYVATRRGQRVRWVF